MTRKEVAEKYLAGSGIRITEGDGFEFIIPYIIMDVVYNEYYLKVIKRVKAKHEFKQLRERWRRAYDTLNRDFLKYYDEDQQGDVMDFMDEFTSYVSNDLTILRIQVLNLMPQTTMEDADIVIAGAISGMLSEAAHLCLKNIYKKTIGINVEHPAMKEITYCARRFASLWFERHCEGVVDYDNPKIEMAVHGICNRIVEFGKNKMRKAS